MALYDDKWWLLSHIQNSFVMCDDSGNSELVFAASDRAFAADRAAHMAREEGTEEFLGSLTDYLQQDEQEAQVGSFEIRLGRNQVHFHLREGLFKVLPLLILCPSRLVTTALAATRRSSWRRCGATGATCPRCAPSTGERRSRRKGGRSRRRSWTTSSPWQRSRTGTESEDCKE